MDGHWPHRISRALWVWLGAGLLCASADAQARKLTPDLHIAPREGVGVSLASPDGVHAVYTFAGELFGAPADGSAPPVELSGVLVAGGSVTDVLVSPDSQWVVYRADQDADEHFELYSAPIDGSAPALKLSGALAGDVLGLTGTFPEELRIQIAPDSSRVLYEQEDPTHPTSRRRVGVTPDLFSVPIDGSAAPVKLLASPRSFAIASGSGDVAVRVALVPGGAVTLVVVPIDGSGAPQDRSGTLVPGGNVKAGPWLSADGARAVYVADAEVDERDELYSAPIAGGAPPTKLSGTLVAGGDVRSWQFGGTSVAISPDSARVVYAADADVDERHEFYSVPLAGGASPVKISPTLPTSYTNAGFAISPDSSRVLCRQWDNNFELTRTRLFSTPIATAGAAVPLSNVGMSAVSSLIDAAFDRVIFVDRPSFELGELYSVPLDGSAAPLLIGHLPSEGRDAQLEIALTQSGDTVLFFATQPGEDRVDLFSVPSDGSASPVLLVFGHGPSPGRRVLHAGAEVLFRMDAEWRGKSLLYSAPVDGAAAAMRVSDVPLTQPAGDLVGLALTPDKRWAVVRGDPLASDAFELFRVPLDGSRRLQRLSQALPSGRDVTSFRVAPTSAHVVYLADEDTDDAFELFGVALAGPGAPVQLSLPLVAGGDVTNFELSPNGGRVAYLADAVLDGEQKLHGVGVDGSGPLVYSPTLVVGGDVLFDFRFATSTRVVYRADQDVDETFELYLSDGVLPPVQLNPALVAGGDVVEFALAAGGTRVVYRADQDVDEQVELYARTGVAAAVQISREPSGPHRDVVAFAVTPDGASAVYTHDAFVDGFDNLYRAPLDAGAPPVQLNQSMPLNRDVGLFRLTPDGTRVLYLADVNTLGVDELFSVPLDQSSAPVRVNGPLGLGESIIDFTISADSGTVAFRVNPAVRVFVAPADGSAGAGAVPLDAVPPASGAQLAYALSPRGDHVVVASDTGRFTKAPSAAPSLGVVLGDPGYLASPVNAVFALTDQELLFLGDYELPDVVELFAASLARSKARAPAPGRTVTRAQ